MNIIEAVRLAQIGKKIRNTDWDENTFIYLSINPGVLYWTRRKDVHDYQIPYVPTCGDFSDDWEIYEEKPKTYTFQEAFEAFMEGKTISRLLYVVRYRKEHLHKSGIIFSYDDVLATDWIIIENEL